MKRCRQDGFTLVELLVAVVILGIIMGSLATAMVLSFRTTDDASSRLERAHDVQISTAYFASDVQSAEEIRRDAAPFPIACGMGVARLVLAWTDRVSSSPADDVKNVVTYRRLPAPDQAELVRSHCRTGAGVPGGQQLETQTVSHFVGADAVPQCVIPPVTASVDCPLTPSQPREIIWSLTDTVGDKNTLRATRRIA